MCYHLIASVRSNEWTTYTVHGKRAKMFSHIWSLHLVPSQHTWRVQGTSFHFQDSCQNHLSHPTFRDIGEDSSPTQSDERAILGRFQSKKLHGLPLVGISVIFWMPPKFPTRPPTNIITCPANWWNLRTLAWVSSNGANGWLLGFQFFMQGIGENGVC